MVISEYRKRVADFYGARKWILNSMDSFKSVIFYSNNVILIRRCNTFEKK